MDVMLLECKTNKNPDSVFNDKIGRITIIRYVSTKMGRMTNEQKLLAAVKRRWLIGNEVCFRWV